MPLSCDEWKVNLMGCVNLKIAFYFWEYQMNSLISEWESHGSISIRWIANNMKVLMGLLFLKIYISDYPNSSSKKAQNKLKVVNFLVIYSLFIFSA